MLGTLGDKSQEMFAMIIVEHLLVVIGFIAFALAY